MKKVLMVVGLILLYFAMIVVIVKVSPTVEDNNIEKIKEEEKPSNPIEKEIINEEPQQEDEPQNNEDREEEDDLSDGCLKYKTDSSYVNKISDKYVSVTKLKNEDSSTGVAYLMDINCSKKLLTAKDDKEDTWIPKYIKIDNGFYAYIGLCIGSCSDITRKVYTPDLKEIDSGKIEYAVLDNNNIRIWKKGSNLVKEYDLSGKLLNTIDEYTNVLGITNTHILYNNNNVLKLVDNDGNETVISSVTSDKDFVYITYYDENIYIRVIDKSVTLDTLWDICQFKDECEYETKEEYQEDYGIYDVDFGYDYNYNIKTKELTKKPNFFPLV